MAPLTPYIESGALQTGEIDLTAGYVTDPETGEKYLMGVPTDSLTVCRPTASTRRAMC